MDSFCLHVLVAAKGHFSESGLGSDMTWWANSKSCVTKGLLGRRHFFVHIAFFHLSWETVVTAIPRGRPCWKLTRWWWHPIADRIFLIFFIFLSFSLFREFAYLFCGLISSMYHFATPGGVLEKSWLLHEELHFGGWCQTVEIQSVLDVSFVGFNVLVSGYTLNSWRLFDINLLASSYVFELVVLIRGAQVLRVWGWGFGPGDGGLGDAKHQGVDWLLFNVFCGFDSTFVAKFLRRISPWLSLSEKETHLLIYCLIFICTFSQSVQKVEFRV